MSEVRDELDPPFEIQEPANLAGPVLFNSPHSGSVYPRGFLQSSRLDLATLRRSEDSYVDDLIGGVVGRGYPLMRAHFPRCFVDVNREPYELDPRMFEGRLPSFANTRSMRVAGGLGTVARVVGDAQEIYEQRLPVDEAMRRIESLYQPFHRALRRLFTRMQRSFGAAVLVDCHSMPSSAGQKDERPRPDFVIGDRYGTSCVPLVAECVDRDALLVDFLRIADHARDGAEPARHPHRAGIREGRQPAVEHARVQFVRLAIDVDKAAREMRVHQRVAAADHATDQVIDVGIFRTAQRTQVEPRALQETARIDRSGMRRVEQHRAGQIGRLLDLKRRIEFVADFAHAGR